MAHGSYFSPKELAKLGCDSLGSNVLVRRKASIHDHHHIALSGNLRIDDFRCLSGKINVGRNTHPTPFCLVAEGSEGVRVGDFCTPAYRVSLLSKMDDCRGLSMVNLTIFAGYKPETKKPVYIGSHAMTGAGSVLPLGIELAIETAIGATSLVTRSIDPWGLYSLSLRCGERIGRKDTRDNTRIPCGQQS